MFKIRISVMSSIILALSMLLYAFRGKYGAILITIEALLMLIIVSKQKKKYVSNASIYAAIFLFAFAVMDHYFRSISPEFYLIIGYLTTSIILLDTQEEHFDALWKSLKRVAVFEAIGIFTQLLLPGLYYFLMSIVLPADVVSSIRNRNLAGYYTGFSHEVSFTMFLIVLGLGLYLFDGDLKKNKRKLVVALFLFASLIVSGKRATLVFFIVAFFLTQFIRSDSKVKIIKYTLWTLAGIGLVWVTYPWWSQLSAFSRVNDFIKYFAKNDIIGMTSGRTVIYENAIQLWNSHRWFGIGWGNFKYSVNQNIWYSGFDVHNCFLQVLCETGIMGFFFFLLIIITSIINSIRGVLLYRHCKNEKVLILAVFCCYVQLFFILYSLTEPILYEYTDYVVYFLCFNCSNLLVKKRKALLKTNVYLAG